jgi:hypothetical protein
MQIVQKRLLGNNYTCCGDIPKVINCDKVTDTRRCEHCGREWTTACSNNNKEAAIEYSIEIEEMKILRALS